MLIKDLLDLDLINLEAEEDEAAGDAETDDDADDADDADDDADDAEAEEDEAAGDDVVAL